MIAAGHRRTAEAGAEVLRAGGTAVDGAIAALAMACVCEPVLCSPGGGGFAMFRRRAGEPISLLDFFPQTPRARRQAAGAGVQPVSADFGTALQEFMIGPATAATPGFFPGLHRLAETGGTWPVSDLFAAAIRAGRDGIEVTEFQHFLSTVVEPIVTATESARRRFAPEGQLRPPGSVLRNPGLAEALVIAAAAHDGGAVVDAMIEDQQPFGHLTGDDFARYLVQDRQPLLIEVGDAEVHLNPLPAASGVLIAHSIASTESTMPADLARAFAATSRAREAAAGDLSELSDLPIRRRGTTHVSVIDAEGGACAVTTSNGEGTARSSTASASC